MTPLLNPACLDPDSQADEPDETPYERVIREQEEARQAQEDEREWLADIRSYRQGVL